MARLPQLPFTSLFTKHLVLASLICLALGLVWPNAWASIILGAALAFIPQVVFALISFRVRGARQANKVVQSLFLAATVKFGLTVVLFTLVLLLVPPSNPISFISTYAAVVLLSGLNFWLLK